MIDRLHTTAERPARRGAAAPSRPAGCRRDLDLAALGAAGTYVQIVALPDGRVIAASPGFGGVPALTTMTEGGDIVRVEAAQAAGLPGERLVVTREQVDAPVGRVSPAGRLPVRQRRSQRRRRAGGPPGRLPAAGRRGGRRSPGSWPAGPCDPWRRSAPRWRPSPASTLDRRVPVPRSGDEVARLADTMNAMLDRLEDASTRQQRFVADASHELRSPVAAIRTELEVAQRTAAPGRAGPRWPSACSPRRPGSRR